MQLCRLRVHLLSHACDNILLFTKKFEAGTNKCMLVGDRKLWGITYKTQVS